ncbi:MAG: virulence-associated protein VapB [Rhodoferax sp.]|uniref:antitoxin n=1 Tax=Rhodoferax sp. TaxID=50421 RepID=UPI0030164C6C
MPFASEKTADYQTDAPVRHVRLFRNGANQALRIPKEFELPTQEATLRRVGNTLVIEPLLQQHPKGSLGCLMAALATLEPIDEPFPDVDEGLLPLDDITL